MACPVNAKIKRSLKAAAVVGILGLAAGIGARPFVHFKGEDTRLDTAEVAYVDLEHEHPTAIPPHDSDSEQEDRAHRPVERVVQVGDGDTLKDLLLRAGVESADANAAIEALTDVYNPRSLKAGQKITVTFDKAPHGFGHGDFHAVSLNADPIRQVSAKRQGNGFEASESKRQVVKQLAHYSGTIKSSLFESAQSAGVPPQVIVTMIRALSYDVDFQRDIQAGDKFDVMFEAYYDTKGKLVRHGDMMFAAMNLQGNPISMYRYEDSSGQVDYFNDKGEAVKKALLKTPVDGAKITSGFGMRHHPILGYTKMHKGIDFGVPTGTPIMAAGDGTVEEAGSHGAYGNYVRIRHTNNYATAYAHMSRFAQGIHSGKRVSQGQIIGFVGATGRATGAHLHYEILLGGNQVNPMSVKVPTGIKLAGKELDRFKDAKRQTETLLAKIPPSTKLAMNGAGKPGTMN